MPPPTRVWAALGACWRSPSIGPTWCGTPTASCKPAAPPGHLSTRPMQPDLFPEISEALHQASKQDAVTRTVRSVPDYDGPRGAEKIQVELRRAPISRGASLAARMDPPTEEEERNAPLEGDQPAHSEESDPSPEQAWDSAQPASNSGFLTRVTRTRARPPSPATTADSRDTRWCSAPSSPPRDIRNPTCARPTVTTA